MNQEIINGNCLEVMRGFADKSFDLVLTDPPYGIEAGGLLKASYKNKTRTMAANRTNYGVSNWDNSTPSQEIFDEIQRISKKQVIFGGQYFTDKLPPSGKWLVWDKKTEEKYHNAFSDCELAWTSEDGAVRIIRHLWHGMIQEDMGSKEKRYHPTQKPVPVIEWVLSLFPDETTVLDPFAGGVLHLLLVKI